MIEQNDNKKPFRPFFILSLVTIGIAIGILLPPRSRDVANGSSYRRSDKLSSILNIIESNYVDSVDRSRLVESAIESVLEQLDPHSIYLSAKEQTLSNESLQGNFDGIGISFNTYTDTVVVISTISGGPSEKAGIEAGDRIIYVNDSLIAGQNMTDEEIMSLLKGPKKSMVNVKVLRQNFDELLSFDITRDEIPIYSVNVAYMITPSIGYIKVETFALTTYNEFREALQGLQAKGMKQLIVDLRGNSGGIMEASIQMANEFLEKGRLIVYTEGRSQPRSNAYADGKGVFQDGELVVLIDEWSASASEIFAGAIQDNDRGTIIGRRSYGKGLVQEPIYFSDGSGMRLTIARYYTPTGRSIQKPYDDGVEKYYADIETRFINHEFEISDSIHFPDSLKFTTPNGKIVYGGGGIMPDRFIPIDTVGITKYFAMVRSYIYEYAIRFSDTHRGELSAFDNYQDIDNYLNQQQLIEKFVLWVSATHNIPENNRELNISKEIIHNQLKAYIARNIIDNNGFYPIWNKNDITITYSVKYLEGDI